MKILVVDDDNIIRMGLCKIIKKNDEKMYRQSAEILKRDFFKNLLFSNKDITSKYDNSLIKELTENINGMESCSFHYKDYI